MSSGPPPWQDGYETTSTWPPTAETERFIAHQRQVSYGHDTAHTSYDGHKLADYAKPPRSRSRCFGLGWWALDILALALAISSFIAIISVLRVYDGRTIGNLGLPTGLTLNAIVAALATVCRSALMVPVASSLMQELWLFFAKEAKKTAPSSRLSHLGVFDSASRGTWGSLVLIFRLHGRRLFATSAALITILSLAFGTFVQQAITYNRVVNLSPSSSHSPGNIPRAESWSDYSGRPSEGMTPRLPLIAGFYDGAMRGGVAPPPVNCPLGNCTFPLTPSLAICGGCVPSKPTKVDCPAQDETELLCNYTMPSGSKMQLWNFDVNDNPDGGVCFQVVPSATGAYYKAAAVNRAYVANFDLLGVPYNSTDWTSSNKDLNAAECALWMCVQTYNTSVHLGIQTQEIVSQVAEINTAHMMGDRSDGSELIVSFPPLPTAEDPEHVTNITVNGLATEAIRWFFDENIGGNITLNQEGWDTTNNIVLGIWNGTRNLDAWIENVARSMTGVIRTTETKTRPQYNGTAQAMGVQIRWFWLLLPLVLVSLSAFILIGAITRTASSPVEAWKGNPLVCLLFGVDEQLKQAAYGRATTRNGFEEAIGSKNVRLIEEDGNFWKFKPC